MTAPAVDLARVELERALLEAIARETFAVMHASGFETHWATADDYLATFWNDLLPPTARHESSMLTDLRAGRTTEIDALCGAVVKLASQYDTPAPLHTALLTLIRTAQSR